MVALAVGGFAALTLDQLALAGVALLGWLVANGFLDRPARRAVLARFVRYLAHDDVLVFAARSAWPRARRTGRSVELRARWRAEVEGPSLAPDVDEEERHAMPDVWYVLLTVVLFGLLALVVKAVETAVSAANLVGLILAVVLTVFLVVGPTVPGAVLDERHDGRRHLHRRRWSSPWRWRTSRWATTCTGWSPRPGTRGSSGSSTG